MEKRSLLADVAASCTVARRADFSSSSSSTGSCNSTATSPGAAEFVGLKDSLMNQLPPEPPSPYKPQAQKPVSSVLPSLFQAKRETDKLRDKKLRQLREAEAAAEAEFKKTQIPIKRTLGKKRRMLEEQEQASRAAESTAATVKDTSAYDECMKEFLFFEAQRQQVVAEENALRTELETEEELLCTRMLLDHFDDLAHAITASELTEAERQRAAEVVSEEDSLLQAAKEARAEERRALLQGIAANTSARLAEERLARQLQKTMQELLPLHEEGRNAIMDEAHTALLEVFDWERTHRPLGPGCFISGPVEDPRLRYHKKVKKGRFHKLTKTERAIKELKSSSVDDNEAAAEGALVVYKKAPTAADYVDPPNSTPERVFVEEGKDGYTREKSARHEAIRRAMALQDLFAAEESERAGVLLEESEDYMPMLLHGVDGLYAARRAARERERREAEEAKTALAAQIARMDAKAHVLAQDFASHPHTQQQLSCATCTHCGELPPAANALQKPSEEEGKLANGSLGQLERGGD